MTIRQFWLLIALALVAVFTVPVWGPVVDAPAAVKPQEHWKPRVMA
jgi:hypothetical protein